MSEETELTIEQAEELLDDDEAFSVRVSNEEVSFTLLEAVEINDNEVVVLNCHPKSVEKMTVTEFSEAYLEVCEDTDGVADVIVEDANVEGELL